MFMTKKNLLIFIIGCMQEQKKQNIYRYIPTLYIIYIDAEIKYQLKMFTL